MMNYTANLHSSADSFCNIPFSCRSFLVPGFRNQVVYLVIFSARDVHGWKAQEKTSVHIKGERSGRWKTKYCVTEIGFYMYCSLTKLLASHNISWWKCCVAWWGLPWINWWETCTLNWCSVQLCLELKYAILNWSLLIWQGAIFLLAKGKKKLIA